MSHSHGVVLVSLPPRIPDLSDTVVVLQMAGPLKVEPAIVTAATDMPMHLD